MNADGSMFDIGMIDEDNVAADDLGDVVIGAPGADDEPAGGEDGEPAGEEGTPAEEEGEPAGDPGEIDLAAEAARMKEEVGASRMESIESGLKTVTEKLDELRVPEEEPTRGFAVDTFLEENGDVKIPTADGEVSLKDWAENEGAQDILHVAALMAERMAAPLNEKIQTLEKAGAASPAADGEDLFVSAMQKEGVEDPNAILDNERFFAWVDGLPPDQQALGQGSVQHKAALMKAFVANEKAAGRAVAKLKADTDTLNAVGAHRNATAAADDAGRPGSDARGNIISLSEAQRIAKQSSRFKD